MPKDRWWSRGRTPGTEPGTKPPADELTALRLENDRLRRAVDELSTLNDLARDIGGSFDPDHIIRSIISRARKAIHAEQVTVHVIDPVEEEKWKTLYRTRSSQTLQDRLHLTAMLEGWMLIHKQPLLSPDPATDPRLSDTIFPDPPRSLLAVPLMSQSRVIGILTAFNRHGDGGFDEDDQRLLSIIAAQSAQVLENARLIEEEKALKVIQEQMLLAREIQLNLLPDTAPEVPGYELAGDSLPAQEVGGDYYDFIPVGGGRLAVCLGDVSGKGLPASMLMANLQATLRSQAQLDTSVATSLERANSLLWTSTPPEKFVTLFYAVLDPVANRLVCGCAGHEPPLLWRAATGEIESCDESGLIIGAFPGLTYDEYVLDLEPGDVLLVYSDGVIDAENAAEEPFGCERLVRLLGEAAGAPAHMILRRVVAAVTEHAGGAAQVDDITLCIVRRDPA